MVLGVFRIPDGLAYNFFVRLSPASKPSDCNILIIKAGFERMESGDDVWLTLLRELRRQEARQIVFTFLPARASRQFYEEAVKSNVIFGRRIHEDASITESRTLEPFPSAAANLTLHFGVVADPIDEFGMHRHQQMNITVGDSVYPSLEAAAAASYRGIPSRTTAPVLINFIGKSGGLPHVSLERALGEGLIPELVKGKSVIIGFSDLAHEPGLHTPLSGKREVPLIEYRAHALDTLIANKAISETPLIIQMFFIALIVFAGLLLQTLLEIRFLTWLTFAAVTVYLGACWLLLQFGRVWFPVTESMVAFSLTFLLIFRQRVLLAEEAVDNMLLSLSARLKQRVMPESFYSSQEYWAQVITMVNQTLNLTRAIFLEKVPGDHRLREVKALHCSITDISELRRDYNRTPYSTAIAGGGPIRLEHANYLIKSEVPEDQYLVPLIFGGQPLGFWAFGIDPDTAAKIPHFKETIRDFGKQISELLFRRQEWQSEQLRKNSFAGNYLDLSRDIPHEEMRKSLDLFERRVNTLETVFAELGTATILYDLFGRVLLVNRRMLEITKDAGLTTYEMTALDLVVTLCGLSTEEIREHFHNVLIEHAEITLSTSRHLNSGANYILRIRPLLESDQKLPAENASLFSIYGILLELVDLREITRHEQIKDQLTGGLSLRLEDQSISCRGAYPVDGTQLLRDAAALAERKLLQRRITTSIVAPGAMPSVWASPRTLEVAFLSLILMLGNDAVLNSVISIEVVEEKEFVAYRFASTGFGMPTDVLNRNLFSDELTDSVQHRRARTAIRHIQQWQGTIKASSEIGEGTSIAIRLKKFTLRAGIPIRQS